MTIQHRNITEADLHEPKGVSLAPNRTIYVANGLGSGAWRKLVPNDLTGLSSNGQAGQVLAVDGAGNNSLLTAPHGHVSFFNIGSPLVINYPSTPTKIQPSTTGSGVSRLISENSVGTLTYTGPSPVVLHLNYSVVVDQTTGATRDIVVGLYKNNSLVNAQTITTTESGNKKDIVGMMNVLATTGDEFSLYITNLGASGNINIYSYQLNAILAGA